MCNFCHESSETDYHEGDANKSVDGLSLPSKPPLTEPSIRTGSATTSDDRSTCGSSQAAGPSTSASHPSASAANQADAKTVPELAHLELTELQDERIELGLDLSRGVAKGLMKTNNFQLKVNPFPNGRPRLFFQYLITGLKRESSTEATPPSTHHGIGAGVQPKSKSETSGKSAVQRGKMAEKSAAPTRSFAQASISSGGQPDSDPIAGTTQKNGPPPIRASVRRRVVYLLLLHLQRCHPELAIASDMKETFISSAPLQIAHVENDIHVDFYGEDEASARTDCPKYLVALGKVKQIPVSAIQEYFERADPTMPSPTDAINDVEKALNIILCQQANDNTIRSPDTEPAIAFDGDKKYYSIPSSWKYVDQKSDRSKSTLDPQTVGSSWNLTAGLMALPGYIRSTRGVLQPRNPFLFNINTKIRAFYLGSQTLRITMQQLMIKYYNESPIHSRPNWEQTEAYIKGLRVMTTYLKDSPAAHESGDRHASHERIFTISGLALTKTHGSDHWDSTQKDPYVGLVEFPSPYEDDNITVRGFFRRKHQVDLEANVFTVRVGDNNFQPATKLEVLPGQVYKKNNQVINQGCRSPRDNYNFITGFGRPMFEPETVLARQFGILLGSEPMNVDYNVFTGPGVLYQGQNRADGPTWELADRAFIKAPENAATWSMVQLHSNQDAQHSHQMGSFQKAMQTSLNDCGLNGLTFDSTPFILNAHLARARTERDVQQALDKWYARHQNIKVLVVLLPDRCKSYYPAVKRWGDQTVGLATICVLEKFRKSKNGPSGMQWPTDASVFQNLCLKFNPKACSKSVNHRLASHSALLTAETMLVGMDVVSHSPN